MAPEQFLGEEVTAKADQFALCVSLWEGLFGERPFAGTSRADLIANVTRGRVREVPKQSRVPAWLREVLMRGRAIDEKALGPDHREVAASLANLAGVQYSTGDYAQARTLNERALAISEKHLGPTTPTSPRASAVSPTRMTVPATTRRQGRCTSARSAPGEGTRP